LERKALLGRALKKKNKKKKKRGEGEKKNQVFTTEGRAIRPVPPYRWAGDELREPGESKKKILSEGPRKVRRGLVYRTTDRGFQCKTRIVNLTIP